MDANNEKYSAYISEIYNATIKQPRPFALIIKNEEFPKFVYVNEEFEMLVTWGITASRIERDREFQVKCLDLFNCPDGTTDQFRINLSRKNIQIDFYCQCRRTSQAGTIPLSHCDLLIAQVDTQDYQESLRGNNTIDRGVKAGYQAMVIDEQIKSQNSRLKELFDSMDELNSFVVTQSQLNDSLIKTLESLNNHWLFKLTANLSLKSISTGVGLLLALLNAFNLATPAIIEGIQKAYEAIESQVER